jgi:hypothetical protein
VSLVVSKKIREDELTILIVVSSVEFSERLDDPSIKHLNNE